MSIGNIIVRVGDGIGHLVSAALGIDAINNTANGNYEIAAFEAATATYIQVKKYIDRKYDPMPILKNITNNLDKCKYKMNQIDDKFKSITPS